MEETLQKKVKVESLSQIPTPVLSTGGEMINLLDDEISEINGHKIPSVIDSKVRFTKIHNEHSISVKNDQLILKGIRYNCYNAQTKNDSYRKHSLAVLSSKSITRAWLRLTNQSPSLTLIYEELRRNKLYTEQLIIEYDEILDGFIALTKNYNMKTEIVRFQSLPDGSILVYNLKSA